MNREGRGHAIFINGIQSAGKSTLARELEERTSSFRVLHSDDLVKEALQARPAQPLRPAALIELVKATFASTLDTIDEWLQSSSVIVEGAWTREQVSKTKERFKDSAMYVVLRIDEEERKRRESARKDRDLKHWSPSWHEKPGPDALYDLILDSGTLSQTEGADAVLNRVVDKWGEGAV